MTDLNDRFEVTTIDEVNEARQYFNRFRDEINLFHDYYVAGIEIKFENYRSLNDDGRSTTIGSADKTIILTVDTYPYGKEDNQYVKVEFKGVKSFEIFSSPETGPTWAISHTLISDDDGIGLEWEFGFICGDAKFLVICSKLVFHKSKL